MSRGISQLFTADYYLVAMQLSYIAFRSKIIVFFIEVPTMRDAGCAMRKSQEEREEPSLLSDRIVINILSGAGLLKSVNCALSEQRLGLTRSEPLAQPLFKNNAIEAHLSTLNSGIRSIKWKGVLHFNLHEMLVHGGLTLPPTPSPPPAPSI